MKRRRAVVLRPSDLSTRNKEKLFNGDLLDEDINIKHFKGEHAIELNNSGIVIYMNAKNEARILQFKLSK